MPTHLQVIFGGKVASLENSARSADEVRQQVKLVIAIYLENMLVQLEAVARRVSIEDLAHSLSLVRQEAHELVRGLNQPT